MFAFLRSLKISNEGSLIGSIGFMFCGFITTWMAYATLGYAILFLPLALWAIEKFYQTQKQRFLILLAVSFPLSFFSGHFQISIYFLLFVVAYIIFKLFQTRNLHKTFYIILYALAGILLSLPQLLPSIEAYTQSLRSSLFAKAEVIPWGYFSTFLAPDFLGNPVTRNDWFGHYAEWNAYIGLIPLMLGVYSLFRNRTKEIYFLCRNGDFGNFIFFSDSIFGRLNFSENSGVVNQRRQPHYCFIQFLSLCFGRFWFR